MIFGHLRTLILHNYHRSTDAPTVACHVDRTKMMVGVHTHELAETTGTPQLSEVGDQASRGPGQPHDIAINIDDIRLRRIDLGSR